MNGFADFPVRVFALTFVLMWMTAWAAAVWLRANRSVVGDVRENFRVVQAAVLTLLGLMIGFTFSMAISRYEQRRVLEEAEANFIGTQFLRADLLPAVEGDTVRKLLRRYTDLRIDFYTVADAARLAEVDAKTTAVQQQLWQSIQGPAGERPNQITALVVSGMNDVINSQGFTQAAWWNRVPLAAWGLIFVVGLLGSVSVGVGARDSNEERVLLPVLPFVVAVSFFFISDIDSPRYGLILVEPVDLLHLAQSLQSR